MYWTLDNVEHDDSTMGVYRGYFDVATNSMFDGEFQAGVGPRGRIVLMQLVKKKPTPTTPEVTPSSGYRKHVNVEMVELNKSLV